MIRISKNVFLLVNLLIVAVIFTSVAELKVTPPNSWQRQFRVPEGVLQQYIAPKANKKFNANLIISYQKTPSEIQNQHRSIGKYISEKQIRMFPMYKVLEQKELQNGEFKGSLLVASYAYGELDLVGYQFYFIKGDLLYSTIFTCLINDMNNLRAEFEKCITTISFNDDGN